MSTNFYKLFSSTLFHGVLFQLFWFAVVSGGNRVAVVLTPLYLLLLYLQRLLPELSSRLLIIVCAGIGVDIALWCADWIRFAQWPIWLLLLWVGFMASFRTVFAPLQTLTTSRWSAVGGAGGALSYWAGMQLGAVEVVNTVPCYVIWILSWAALFYFLRRWTLPESRRARIS